MFQPLTHRQIVELVSSECHEDGEHEDADGDEDVSAERCVLMTVSPRHLHVDERIMSDIDGIANLTKESVDGFGFTALNAAASTHRYDEREEYEYTHGLVESVGPTGFALSAKSHPGHAEQYDYHQRTPPESTTYLY